MYKTVKQGDNCLQYTILPQTEEVIGNSGMKGIGRDFSPSVHIRKTRRSGKGRITLIFPITTLVIFILSGVPLYVLAKAFLSENSEAVGSTPVTTTHKRVLDEELYDPVFDGAKTVKTTARVAETTSFMTTVKVDTTFKTKKPWMMPALKRLLSTSTEIPTDVPITASLNKSSLPYVRQRESNNDLMLDRLRYNHWTDSEEVIVKPTATLTPFEARILQDKPEPRQATTIKASEHEDSSTTQIARESTETMRMEIGEKKFKEIKNDILDDDDYSDYKDPMVDEDDVQSGADDVKMSQTKVTWLQDKWPFVDPSSYFQWTGYSAGDNLLLTAILAAALSALLVLGIICYAIRRRQRQARRAQDIGKITSDLQADDNTNLLTAENMSEDD